MAVFIITDGTMGAGKSYCRGPVYWEKFFEGGGQRIVTNIHVNVGAFVDYYNARHPRNPIEPSQICYLDGTSWRREESEAEKEGLEAPPGPWDADLRDGDHVQIDEAHLVCPRTGMVNRRRAWRDFLAEVRHEGVTFEFITQDFTGIDELVVKRCAERYRLVEQAGKRELLTGLTWGDYFQLMAKMTGSYAPWVTQVRVTRGAVKHWEEQDKNRIVLLPSRYPLYDSFSASARGKKGRRKREYEVLSWPRFLWWIYSSNRFHVTWRAFVIVFFVWFGTGGCKWIMSSAFSMLPGHHKTVAASEKSDASVADLVPAKLVGRPAAKSPPVAPVHDGPAPITPTRVLRASMVVGNLCFIDDTVIDVLRVERGVYYLADGTIARVTGPRAAPAGRSSVRIDGGAPFASDSHRAPAPSMDSVKSSAPSKPSPARDLSPGADSSPLVRGVRSFSSGDGSDRDPRNGYVGVASDMAEMLRKPMDER